MKSRQTLGTCSRNTHSFSFPFFSSNTPRLFLFVLCITVCMSEMQSAIADGPRCYKKRTRKKFRNDTFFFFFFSFSFFFFPPLLKCCEGLLISSVIFHISSVLLQGCTFYSACYVSKILIIDVILYIYREKNLSILSIFLCLFVL